MSDQIEIKCLFEILDAAILQSFFYPVALIEWGRGFTFGKKVNEMAPSAYSKMSNMQIKSKLIEIYVNFILLLWVGDNNELDKGQCAKSNLG